MIASAGTARTALLRGSGAPKARRIPAWGVSPRNRATPQFQG
jgi:hypothetical protein